MVPVTLLELTTKMAIGAAVEPYGGERPIMAKFSPFLSQTHVAKKELISLLRFCDAMQFVVQSIYNSVALSVL